MNSFLKKYIFTIVGIILGSIGGYAYYYYIGCATGACPLTSNPYISTAYGALIGYLLFDMFKRKEKRNEKA